MDTIITRLARSNSTLINSLKLGSPKDNYLVIKVCVRKLEEEKEIISEEFVSRTLIYH